MEKKENEKLISADFQELNYCGRIDFSNPKAPIFIFPASSVSMLFTGNKLKILVKNNHGNCNNYLGYILDGVQKKVALSFNNINEEIILATELQEDKVHEITVFKREDICHEFTFCGFVLDQNGKVEKYQKKAKKFMEFYGESSCVGANSNVWDSYAMKTAINLKSCVSIIAKSGVALLDKGSDIGMENIYDKLHCNPLLGDITDWSFKLYIPQVVVIDIGQNDSYPEDYMKNDKDGEKARAWKNHYSKFVLDLRKRYPNAFIVLTTTIMEHHPSWDRAIGAVCQDVNDEKIVHFLYEYNGRGTNFGSKAMIAEQMSFELSMFLKGLGKTIWEIPK